MEVIFFLGLVSIVGIQGLPIPTTFSYFVQPVAHTSSFPYTSTVVHHPYYVPFGHVQQTALQPRTVLVPLGYHNQVFLAHPVLLPLSPTTVPNKTESTSSTIKPNLTPEQSQSLTTEAPKNENKKEDTETVVAADAVVAAEAVVDDVGENSGIDGVPKSDDVDAEGLRQGIDDEKEGADEQGEQDDTVALDKEDDD